MIKVIWKKIVKCWYMKVLRDRVGYARYLGVRIGEKCQILADPEFAFGTEPWLITIGDHVDITAGVHFLNHEGGIWCARGIDPKYNEYDLFSPITVGNNVMIGIGAVIMPGVHIGNNVIIAGQCVVTKDVPNDAVIAGVPGKQISTVSNFMEKLTSADVVKTKAMSQDEKRKYLQKTHPEWFIG